MSTDRLELVFERDLAFPPSVVFDALTDRDLLSGWWADAELEPRVGGRFDLIWLTSASFPPTHGIITRFEPPLVLGLETDNRGEVEFRLEERPGGELGSSTRLLAIVTVAVESAFVPRVKADWWSNLDQLEGLLRGHPVDWAHWDRDRASQWRGYLAAAGGR